jgi:hypothetical protein
MGACWDAFEGVGDFIPDLPESTERALMTSYEKQLIQGLEEMQYRRPIRVPAGVIQFCDAAVSAITRRVFFLFTVVTHERPHESMKDLTLSEYLGMNAPELSTNCWH